MLYFAYGSNLLTLRLRDRVPSASAMGPAELPGYRLVFHKQSIDGSGKATLEPSEGDTVHGVLFAIDPSDLRALDDFEAGYTRRSVKVDIRKGSRMALTYQAEDDRIDPSLKPYDWYVDLMRAGAEEHELPDEWKKTLSAVESVTDEDTERTERHQAFLRL